MTPGEVSKGLGLGVLIYLILEVAWLVITYLGQ